MGYASLDQCQGSESDDKDYTARTQQVQQPAETRNVTHDLHLHAPRPSLPSESVRRQVRAVTGTTSQQAAEAGVGKVVSPELGEPDRTGRSTQAKMNESPRGPSVDSTDGRRESVHIFGDEHDIPEIGQKVPMNPNAGDVQAPSPAPFGGASHDQDSPSHRPARGHSRTRSGRESSLPPGSYSLHGHGVQSEDKFEKASYEKHPDELDREEQGQYGPDLGSPRPDNELNNIVRSSANKGTGLGMNFPVLKEYSRVRKRANVD